jgi:CMP-N,N'-diacetyllegionaminic acid synthase
VTPPSILAVIPARGGSKGLPGKNIRPLAGLPLIAHSLLCASACPEISRTVVTTDSEEIAAVARDHGADVPFMRPPHLATDDVAMWPVIKHALAETERSDGRSYDMVLLLDPTSPGRLPSDIATAVKTLTLDSEADGIVGVSEPDFSPFWHCVIEEGGYLRNLFPEANQYSRRQEVPPVYVINASLYLWRRELVKGADNWRSGKSLMHVIPSSRAIHIDDLHQFRLAELLIEAGMLKLPWLGNQSERRPANVARE